MEARPDFDFDNSDLIKGTILLGTTKSRYSTLVCGSDAMSEELDDADYAAWDILQRLNIIHIPIRSKIPEQATK